MYVCIYIYIYIYMSKYNIFVASWDYEKMHPWNFTSCDNVCIRTYVLGLCI